MRKLYTLLLIIVCTIQATSQNKVLKPLKLEVTPVRNQGATGTCWCFSTMAFLESEILQKSKKPVDLSEMWLVYFTWADKAKNYFLRQGKAQFSEGALGLDAIRTAQRYGLVPQNYYQGKKNSSGLLSYEGLENALKILLDSAVSNKIPYYFIEKEVYKTLDQYIGTVPKQNSFDYDGKTYTPISFVSALGLNLNDYIGYTSFTDQAANQFVNVRVPDNYNGEQYFNVTLDQLIATIMLSLQKGHTLVWDADVSNTDFKANKGIAYLANETENNSKYIFSDLERQKAYESLESQDDHLMEIFGMETGSDGIQYFWVKNSWGEIGPEKGFLKVSENYLRKNTITIVINKNIFK